MKSITFVIPCLNEEKYLEQCVDSIYNNSYPLELIFVIIVDGLSTDNTPIVIERLQQKYKQLQVIQNDKKITPVAFNLGVKNANTDVVTILGAHSYIDQDYIKTAIDALYSDELIMGVGGKVNNIAQNEVSKAISLAMRLPIAVGNVVFRTSNTRQFVDTITPFYKKEIFLKVGYFNEDLIRNQDDEFNFRVNKAGYKLLFEPTIKINYYVRSSYKKLFKQYYQYGYFKVRVNKLHNTTTSLRQLAPPIFVFSILLLLLFSLFSSIFLMLLCFGIIFYYGVLFLVVANSASNFSHLTNTVWAINILHTSYGLGYLKGLFNFFVLNKEISKSMQQNNR